MDVAGEVRDSANGKRNREWVVVVFVGAARQLKQAAAEIKIYFSASPAAVY